MAPSMSAMPSMGPEIADIILGRDDLSTLSTVLILADLVDALGEGDYTVFAPNNEAFADLDPMLVAELIADPEGALTDVLLYHVVPGIFTAADLMDGATLTTLNGATLAVALDPVTINGANVVVADLLASNGVVHVIDAVLIPPSTP